LLVRRNRREKLRAVLEKFGKRWEGRRRIECTGPWPPFAFARIDSVRKANHDEAATIEAAPAKAVHPAPSKTRRKKSKTRSKPRAKAHSKRKPVPKRRSTSKRRSRRR
jgi:gas vesicle protein GvpL/GvpF